MHQVKDLAKKEKELEAKIAAQEQKLHHFQEATKAAQDEWEDRKKQIASDTEITIAAARLAIEDALKEGNANLAALHKAIEFKRKENALEEDAMLEKVHLLSDEVVDLTLKKEILQTTNIDLERENRELGSEIKVRQGHIEKLTEDETALNSRISDKTTEKLELQEQLDILNGQITDKKAELEELETNFSTKSDTFTRELDILERKKQDVEQEIIANKANDDKVRENLAGWAKDLDEREKNLRIREEQVNIQRQAIARNANLLNL